MASLFSQPLVGVVCVRPGNTVNISFGENATTSRQMGYEVAQALLAVDPKGYDPADNMQLVVPLTPYKEGSSERWPDVGLHATVALQGSRPWTAIDGTTDVVTSEMEKVAGRQIQLSVDPDSCHFLEGSPHNDEATCLVFYFVAFLDAPSKQIVAELRTELGLGEVRNNLHISLAGVAPADGDFTAFRKRFCRPRPPVGKFCDPYLVLTSQTESVSTLPLAVAWLLRWIAGSGGGLLALGRRWANFVIHTLCSRAKQKP